MQHYTIYTVAMMTTSVRLQRCVFNQLPVQAVLFRTYNTYYNLRLRKKFANFNEFYNGYNNGRNNI